jgi:hypothetical protein
MKESKAMQEKTTPKTINSHDSKIASPGIRATSGLQAGFTCPNGWWKKKEGKTNLCCHWVYDPIWRQYIAECNA